MNRNRLGCHRVFPYQEFGEVARDSRLGRVAVAGLHTQRDIVSNEPTHAGGGWQIKPGASAG